MQYILLIHKIKKKMVCIPIITVTNSKHWQQHTQNKEQLAQHFNND